MIIPKLSWLFSNETDSSPDFEAEIAFEKLCPTVRLTSLEKLNTRFKPTLGVMYKPLNSLESFKL